MRGVVFADADLDAAANGLVAGVFAATGQTCMAGSRLIVHEDVRDVLVAKVVARAEQIKQGDPTEAETEMGPVANRPQYEKVLGYLQGAATRAGRSRLAASPTRTWAVCSSDPPSSWRSPTPRSRARRCSGRY